MSGQFGLETMCACATVDVEDFHGAIGRTGGKMTAVVIHLCVVDHVAMVGLDEAGRVDLFLFFYGR